MRHGTLDRGSADPLGWTTEIRGTKDLNVTQTGDSPRGEELDYDTKEVIFLCDRCGG
jgi:hypothetical protein